MNRTTPTPTLATATRRKKTAKAAALACVAVLGLVATACGESDKSTAAPEGRVSPQSAARSSTAPYVLNHYGEENADKGNAERSPQNLVLSEFTTINRISWQQWDSAQAVGTGEVTGAWCLDTCMDKPLKATVTLSDPATVNGKKVFSAFTLKLSGNHGTYDSEDLQGKRPLATR